MVMKFDEGRTMLRLTPRHKRRVSNGLAIFGAFLLAASLLAGGDQPIRPLDRQVAAQPPQSELEAEPADLLPQGAATKSRKFRVNLLLFRN
jgi:hypothetical protein